MPSCGYACDTLTPLPLEPSLKFQAYVNTSPASGSVEAAALMLMSDGPSRPLYGPSSAAVGGLLSTSTVTVALAFIPLGALAVIVTWPADTPVERPDPLTVALPLLLDQVITVFGIGWCEAS